MIPLIIQNDLGNRQLDITWQDNTRQRIKHSLLRNRCRCSQCSSRNLSGQSIPAIDARVIEIRPVGAYGVQLVFDDGHEKGIFPWVALKDM